MKMPKRILEKTYIPDKWDSYIEITEQKATNPTLSLLKKLDATSAKAFEKILDQIESGECRIVIDLDKFSGII